MKVTITSIELQSPFKFFALSYSAMKIMTQLRATNYVKKKTIGFWTKHYTMTLWENENDLKSFAKSSHHLAAMKKGSTIAKEIRTLTIEADQLPNWKNSKLLLLQKGRAVTYS